MLSTKLKQINSVTHTPSGSIDGINDLPSGFTHSLGESGVHCCVLSCKYHRASVPANGVLLVRFPVPPLADLQLCRRWLRSCGLRHAPAAGVVWYVCSQHFSADQLQPIAELTSTGVQLAAVKPGVLPSCRLAVDRASWYSDNSASADSSCDSGKSRELSAHRTAPASTSSVRKTSSGNSRVGRPLKGRSSIYSRAISRLSGGVEGAESECRDTAPMFDPQVRASLVEQAMADYERRRTSLNGRGDQRMSGGRARRSRRITSSYPPSRRHSASKTSSVTSPERSATDYVDSGNTLWSQLGGDSEDTMLTIDDSASSAPVLNINLIVESQLSPPPDLDDMTRQFDGDQQTARCDMETLNRSAGDDEEHTDYDAVDWLTESSSVSSASAPPVVSWQQPVEQESALASCQPLKRKRRAGGDWTVSTAQFNVDSDHQQLAAAESDSTADVFKLCMPHWMPDRFRELLLWRRYLQHLTRRLDAEPVVAPAGASQGEGVRPLLVLRDDLLNDCNGDEDDTEDEEDEGEMRHVRCSLQPEMSDPHMNPSTLVNALSLLHHLRLENMQLRATMLTANRELRRLTSQLNAISTTSGNRAMSVSTSSSVTRSGVSSGSAWTDVELERARQLRQICSSEAYNFVREQLFVRLPSLQELVTSTTRNNINCDTESSGSPKLVVPRLGVTSTSSCSSPCVAPPTITANSILAPSSASSSLENLKDVHLEGRRPPYFVNESINDPDVGSQLGDAPLWDYLNDYVDGCGILPTVAVSAPTAVVSSSDAERTGRGGASLGGKLSLDLRQDLPPAVFACPLPVDSLEWPASPAVSHNLSSTISSSTRLSLGLSVGEMVKSHDWDRLHSASVICSPSDTIRGARSGNHTALSRPRRGRLPSGRRSRPSETSVAIDMTQRSISDGSDRWLNVDSPPGLQSPSLPSLESNDSGSVI